MKKNKIINYIEQDLSMLFNELNYDEYVMFIKNNKFLSFYDSIVDTRYNYLLNKRILNKIHKIIKNKKVSLNPI